MNLSLIQKQQVQITLKLKAGLGNQLFQYSYARALALRSKTELQIDLHWFSNIAQGDTPRIFLLDKYNIPSTIQVVKTKNTRVYNFIQILHKIKAKCIRFFFRYSDHVYYPSLARPISRNTIVEGYWNTEKYFKDFEEIIRTELTLKNELSEEAGRTKSKLLNINKAGTSILLHVRRGDYVSNVNASKHHGLSGVEYYIEALKVIIEKVNLMHTINETSQTNEKNDIDKKDITFILASDDMEWVIEHIVPLLKGVKYEILSNQSKIKDYEELHLMSLCHHFIIANSTFSWWAAWLSDSAEKGGQEKIVIGPKQWVADPTVDTRDVMPEDWIRI